ADDNPSLSPKVMVQAKGGLYRGAGLLARWPRGFARSGRLAALEKAARRTALRTYCTASLRS
ncbi:MAG: hypothetical protein RL240_1435, partial [Planctomycetota bacterium]